MALLIKLRSPFHSLLGHSIRCFTSQGGVLSRLTSAHHPQYHLGPHYQLHRRNLNIQNASGVRFNSLDQQQNTETPSDSTGIVNDRKPNMRTLDRAFAGFEDRCQRVDRVSQVEFVKIFDLFTRVVDQGQGEESDPEQRSNLNLYANILLRSCGKLMMDPPPKHRELLAGNLWTYIKERSIPIDISHYNSLIRTMNENETNFDPKLLLDEINERGFKPDRITYQRLIHQYCMQGDMAGATSLLEKMKDCDMEMTEPVFASLILGYFKQEKPPTITEIFDLMRTNGVEPSSGSYAAAFKSLSSRLEKYPDSQEQLKHLSDLYMKDEAQMSGNDFIEVYVSLLPLRKKFESVDQLLTFMNPTLAGPINYRYKLLSALIRINEFDQASDLFWSQRIPERALKNAAVGGYWIRALAVNRNVPVDFAIKECQMLRAKEYNLKALEQLYFYAAESGNLDMVRGCLKEFGADGEPVKMHLYWPLIAHAKDIQEVVQILKNDLNPLMNSNELMETFSDWVWPKFSDNVSQLFELNKELKYDSNILVASYLNYSVQENKFMEALQFIVDAPPDIVDPIGTESQEEVEGSTNLETGPAVMPRSAVRNIGRGSLISRLMNQIAEQTKDPELVKKAFNMCIVPNQPVEIRSLSALVRVHIINEDYDTALDEFVRVSRKYRVAPCRSELMRHCLMTKNPEKLQKIMDCITEIHGEQNSLFDLAVACLQCNKIKQAQKIFASPGFRVRPVRVYETCRTLSRLNQVDTLEIFVNLTRDMYDVNQEYLYKVLLDTYEKTSNASRALRLWNLMQEEDFQPSRRSLVMIADILERNNIEVPFQKPTISPVDPTIGGRLSNEQR